MSARPLIIERPDHVSRTKRITAILATMVAWLLWLLAWAPVVDGTLNIFGFGMTGKTAWRSLIADFPSAISIVLIAVGMSVLVLVLRYVREAFGPPRKFRPARAEPLGLQKLAATVHATEECLLAWQSEKTLYVEHDEQGAIARAMTIRDTDVTLHRCE
jgi:poly-beta-1,6-N-acetyl-D-glucosamine biosynthesis protein PgaD